MKHQHIARLHIPVDQVVVLTMAVDVRRIFKIARQQVGMIVRRDCLEAAIPAMRSFDVFETAGFPGHWIYRHPDGTNLIAFYWPERQVMMPRRRDLGSRL